MTVKELSECFNTRQMSLNRDCDDIILVFDTYNADSLSTTIKKRRQGKDQRCHQHQVRPNEHDKTKADLTEYLAAKTLAYNQS